MFTQITTSISNFWKRLGAGEKAVLGTFSIIIVIAFSFFMVWVGTPDYVVAFSGISDSDASKIVEKLTAENISYEMNGNGTVMVPSDNVYNVRLMMAQDGIPQSASGFEAFNDSNSFMMNDFTQRVNYQQSLEGELEATISSLESVDSVRVIIVIPEKSLLTEDQAATTASVTVKHTTGSQLPNQQVQAIVHLVASSIEGLSPDEVTVVDVNGNLLASGQPEDMNSSSSVTDKHTQSEMAFASVLEANVISLLDQALGPNKSVVRAQVTMNWNEKESTTVVFDPESAVVRSVQTIDEAQAEDGATISGVPGTDTNLPDGDTTETTTDEDTGLVYTHNEAVTNYEISETNTFEMIAPGTIESISLSVLVDGVTDDDVISSLQNAISAAAGIDTDRGDILVLESLTFDRTFLDEQAVELDSSQQSDQLIENIQLGGVVLLVIILFIYVMRLFSKLKNSSQENWVPVMVPAGEFGAAGAVGGGVSSVPIPTRTLSQSEAFPESPVTSRPSFDPNAFRTGGSGTDRSIEEMVQAIPSLSSEYQDQPEEIDEKRMRVVVNRLAEENPASVAEIIQLWLNDTNV